MLEWLKRNGLLTSSAALSDLSGGRSLVSALMSAVLSNLASIAARQLGHENEPLRHHIMWKSRSEACHDGFPLIGVALDEFGYAQDFVILAMSNRNYKGSGSRFSQRILDFQQIDTVPT